MKKFYENAKKVLRKSWQSVEIVLEKVLRWCSEEKSLMEAVESVDIYQSKYKLGLKWLIMGRLKVGKIINLIEKYNIWLNRGSFSWIWQKGLSLNGKFESKRMVVERIRCERN